MPKSDSDILPSLSEFSLEELQQNFVIEQGVDNGVDRQERHCKGSIPFGGVYALQVMHAAYYDKRGPAQKISNDDENYPVLQGFVFS